MIEFNEIPDVLIEKEDGIRAWLKECAEGYEARIRTLTYTFLDDDDITEMNVKHLEHNYPTDIITFGYLEGKRVSGEVFIGWQTVRGNAMDRKLDFLDELCRVLVHGLLHLMGFDDHSDAEKEEMRREEEKCLILRPKILIGNSL